MANGVLGDPSVSAAAYCTRHLPVVRSHPVHLPLSLKLPVPLSSSLAVYTLVLCDALEQVAERHARSHTQWQSTRTSPALQHQEGASSGDSLTIPVACCEPSASVDCRIGSSHTALRPGFTGQAA